MVAEKCWNTLNGGLLLSDLSEVEMIITQGYEYCKGEEIIFTGTEEIVCPICSGALRMRGTCRRKLRTADGSKIYHLRVMECQNCHRTHRELPTNMIPYKRMDTASIAAIAEYSEEDPAKNAPEDVNVSTWQRVCIWVKWFLDYAERLMEGLYLQHPRLTTFQRSKNTAEQLRQFVRLAVNSGNWIQHRSVSIVER